MGDTRNVADHYRYWRTEAIRADLAGRRSGLHVAIENLQHDLNIGSIVRTANAFNVGGVHIVGRRRWNRRGAMVTDSYLEISHHPDPAALQAWATQRGLALIAIEVTPGALAIEHFPMPARCVLLFGQEGPGLTVDSLARADAVVQVTQHGSTRSLNVAAAAAIAMHCWQRQHGPEPRPPSVTLPW